MKRPLALLVAVQTALVLGLAVAVRSGRIPLGVAGEWEWQRVRVGPSVWPILIAMIALGAFAGFVVLGFRALRRPIRRGVPYLWLGGLVVATMGIQGVIQEGAPDGYGLSKWIIALHAPGSSGYYTVARDQMTDPWHFLAGYPAWIARQDALHTGTHPPGLFLVSRMVLSLAQANPGLARLVVENSPGSVSGAIRIWRETQGLPRADAAALVLIGGLTMLACALTVAPLYALARASLPPSIAWVVASLWALVPSALMFQPTADTAFPLLSTTALALAVWAGRSEGKGGLMLAIGSGLVMAVGMIFTLAFLPVGLIVAGIFLVPPGTSWGRRLALLLATGVGFLATTLLWWGVTSANPFAIWWVNQRNHSRFYLEYPRSYFAWVLVNSIELAVGLGLPVTVLAVVGFAGSRNASRSAWATLLVLTLLTLSGRSLSEVGRLWLPFFPPLLVAAGAGFERMGGGLKTLAAVVGLLGVQVLILEAMIQVVYPI